MKHTRLGTLLLFACTISAFAQKPISSVTIGEKKTIHSAILNEDREYFVYVPDKATQKLPLLLVFDAESLFELTVTTNRFMCYSQEQPQMSEAIVVGIPNTDRNRDMPVPRAFDGKGEVNFKTFLSDELLPYLKANYPLNGHTISIGHSQGGLFVTYLLAKSPENFSWALSLDAPMNVDPKTNSLKEKFGTVMMDKKSKTRYAAIESVYGWSTEFSKFKALGDISAQYTFPSETHESLPAKGIYEGLKFLFHDFAPGKKDLNLAQLKTHYADISQKYGYPYEIPLRVLTGSAARKEAENRKQELIDLADYAESKYGSSVRLSNFKNAASMMSADGAALLDHYLNLPRPKPEQIKPFLGNWVGEQSRKEKPPEGVYMPFEKINVELEITVENGKAWLYIVSPPWAPGKKVEQEIFSVSSDGELIYGFRNRGAGLVISKARINSKGKLEGGQSFIGASIPDDMPDEEKKRQEYIQKNPATFELGRK